MHELVECVVLGAGPGVNIDSDQLGDLVAVAGKPRAAAAAGLEHAGAGAEHPPEQPCLDGSVRSLERGTRLDDQSHQLRDEFTGDGAQPSSHDLM